MVPCPVCPQESHALYEIITAVRDLAGGMIAAVDRGSSDRLQEQDQAKEKEKEADKEADKEAEKAAEKAAKA